MRNIKPILSCMCLAGFSFAVMGVLSALICAIIIKSDVGIVVSLIIAGISAWVSIITYVMRERRDRWENKAW